EEKIKKNPIIKVSGNIEGYDTRLSFRIVGQITELLTDEGEYLRIGDIVAKLNTDEWSKIRNEAKAALKAGEYEQRLAELEYIRAQNLFEQGSVSTEQRDQAKTKAEFTLAEVERLQASLALAETRLGFTDLHSPLNGFVLVRSAEQGEVVQIGATVFTAIDLQNIWLTAYINESDLAKVKLDQKAWVKTDTYPDKKYAGRISFVSSEAEFTPKYIQTTRERVKLVYRIKIRVDNSSLELKPGMPGDGYIDTEHMASMDNTYIWSP
ncbi:unnamed protein product, partial [marine sediment metagenome]